MTVTVVCQTIGRPPLERRPRRKLRLVPARQRRLRELGLHKSEGTHRDARRADVGGRDDAIDANVDRAVLLALSVSVSAQGCSWSILRHGEGLAVDLERAVPTTEATAQQPAATDLPPPPPAAAGWEVIGTSVQGKPFRRADRRSRPAKGVVHRRYSRRRARGCDCDCRAAERPSRLQGLPTTSPSRSSRTPTLTGGQQARAATPTG